MAEAVTLNLTITKEAVEAFAALLSSFLSPDREKREESTKEEERKEINPTPNPIIDNNTLLCSSAVVQEVNRVNKEYNVSSNTNKEGLYPNKDSFVVAAVDKEVNRVCSNQEVNRVCANKDVDRVKESNTPDNPNNRVIGNEEILPPTLEDINNYIREKGYNMDGKRFFNYYRALGWQTKGGTPIVCIWKDYIDSWMTTGGTSSHSSKQKTSDFMTIEERRKTHPFVPTEF